MSALESSRMYMLDNNVLALLTMTERATTGFTSLCRIPEAVLHEASGLPDAVALERFVYPTSPSVVRALMEVMSTVLPADRKLVDLYKNKGAADPLLIACLLDATSAASAALFAPDWVLVTADEAVKKKAAEFNLDTVPVSEFLDLAKAWGL